MQAIADQTARRQEHPTLIAHPDVHGVRVFHDNYIWILANQGQALVVDPGEAAPVQAALHRLHLDLAGILITHHHSDHVDGVPALTRSRFVPVYGPETEKGAIRGITHTIGHGETISICGVSCEVIGVPGHTLEHVAYVVPSSPAILFCGDALFSAGCGRILEGTPAQMHRSLQALGALPGSTLVYCGHEYTAANIQFALEVEPGNRELERYAARVRSLRSAGLPTLPAGLEAEKSINPFLRTSVPAVRASAERRAGRSLESETEVLAILREWKDGFGGTGRL
nr:hydroxyacylglutathione hydrolase [Panacagrimonas sp.]